MKKLKIAIQGVRGAFHQEAAEKFFGEGVEIHECSTFRQLCKAVDGSEVDFAVMAIENTIAGSLLQNYALVSEYHLFIIGETYLRIRMNLMALEGVALKDIRYINSHPIALQQCADFLATMPEGVKVSEADDTAESAKLIAQGNLRDTAAIAGEAAAKLYGLNILEKGIETVKQNYTRFIVLSKSKPEIQDANKASLSFELRHRTGALVEVLSAFSEHGINLTKIQSVPILGRPYQYAFHIDVEWDSRENYDRAMGEVLRLVASMSVYGEYQKGDIKDIL